MSLHHLMSCWNLTYEPVRGRLALSFLLPFGLPGRERVKDSRSLSNSHNRADRSFKVVVNAPDVFEQDMAPGFGDSRSSLPIWCKVWNGLWIRYPDRIAELLMAAWESHERGHLIGLAQPSEINKVIIMVLAFKSVSHYNSLKDMHGNERFLVIPWDRQ